MLVKKASDIRSSEITDKKLYLRRREFLQAAAVTAVGAAAGTLGVGSAEAAPTWPRIKIPKIQKGRSVVHHDRKAEHVSGRHDLQQFLRIRHRQRGPVEQRGLAQDQAVDGQGGRPGRQAC